MKVLILSASTGGGHMKASAALKTYILENNENAIVEIVDTIEYVSPMLNKTITEGYVYLAKNTPRMYGAMYKTTNKDTPLNSFVVAINNQFSKRLMPLLDEFNPDIIISTHPFVTEMVSNLKSVSKIKVPLICLMTDYAPHKTWINEFVDAYIVANDKMVDMMEKMGVKRDIIYPYGIPVDNTFYTRKDREAILRDLDMSPDIPTILIMAGSFGVNDILKIYNNIVKIDLDFQVIVITGRNQKLYDAFKKILSKSDKALDNNKKTNIKNKLNIKKPSILSKEPVYKKPTKLLFFTDEVYKYMSASDLIITKPGGLTVSEALACNLPMAIFNAIPGQEEENADFLIDNNMAVRIGKDDTCTQIIRNLLSNKDELDFMRSSCENFDKSTSGKDIYNLINKLLS